MGTSNLFKDPRVFLAEIGNHSRTSTHKFNNWFKNTTATQANKLYIFSVLCVYLCISVREVSTRDYMFHLIGTNSRKYGLYQCPTKSPSVGTGKEMLVSCHVTKIS